MKRYGTMATVGMWLLGGCLAGMPAGKAAAQEACFGTPKAVYEAGNGPRCVALGDVNGDGALDLAVANEFSDDVSILLNAGDGTLGEQVRYAAGTWPFSVALGDVNGDGSLDLAVANAGGDVSVLLNAGNGTFGAQVRYAIGNQPRAVALGDVNNDGALDLAVAVSNLGGITGDASVLLNSGDGTFGAPVDYAAGDTPSSIALGDVNGDGAVDLAVANRGPYSGGGDVSVLLNAGDGTFGAQVPYAAGFPDSVALGDVNGDGALDLVTNADGGDVSVLLNAGDGGFGEQVPYAAGGFSIAIGDLDEDGDLDLVTSTVVLLNEGGGSLADAMAHGASGTHTALGDVNGDGALDLVVANRLGLSNEVSVVMNAGDGTFTEQGRCTAGDAPQSVAIGDLNDDGGLDLVVANYGSDDLSVVLNAGGDTFAEQVRYGAGDYPGSVALGDVDGDGDLDVVVGNTGCCTGSDEICWNQGISVLLNVGDGTLGNEMRYIQTSRAASVALGDVDGDGDLDVAVGVIGCAFVGPGWPEVWLLPNTGQGMFGVAVMIWQGEPFFGVSSIALGDLDADGDLDLVTDAKVLLNEGGGSFAAAVAHGAIGSDVALGDVNGDGSLDLAVANGGGDVSVLLNAGNGTFEDHARYTAGFDPSSVDMGDLDGDGAVDLVVANYSSDDVSVLRNRGDGTFGEQIRHWTGRAPSSVALGDVNGNSALDLVVANIGSDDISILPNECPVTCPADLDGSADVGFPDLTQLLAVWGACSASCPEDLDGNGDVGFTDLTTLLSKWGPCGT